MWRCKRLKVTCTCRYQGEFESVVPGEKWLFYIIITSYLPRAHHSILREEPDSNYGNISSLWDLMFGTRKGLGGGQARSTFLSFRCDRNEARAAIA
jgi:hypothetical protein